MKFPVQSLKARILMGFFIVILVISLLIALLGVAIIQRYILGTAYDRVGKNLNAARTFYDEEIKDIGEALRLVSLNEDPDLLRKKMDLDYFTVLSSDELPSVRNKIVQQAWKEKRMLGGTRIIAAEELERMAEEVVARTRIELMETQRAKPTSEIILESAMVKEYAVPVRSADGEYRILIYGGRIINQDYALVDRIRALVFGNELYNAKPVGTVTVFQDDVRIATNVLNEDGTRAIGTRVSSEVYEKVLERGQTWHDRAFVVTDWYKTAYEPIRDIEGNIIGILYVGLLEQPYNDLQKNITLVFLAIMIGTTLLAVMVSFLLAGGIHRPIAEVLDATQRISSGDLGLKVNTRTSISDLNELAESFNEMSVKLYDREESLIFANQKLEEANKSYVDLIGFVSHELKGILASAVMNVYSIKDGFLGMVNFKQRKAIDSVARSLDYLTATVKKFLNLGRIEKGELPINKRDVLLKSEVFDVSIHSLAALALSKKIRFDNRIDPELKVCADADLMQVVGNNLIGNAIKYGLDDGEIRIDSRVLGTKVEIEVYNDSVPIAEDQLPLLFQKFSRLNNEATRSVKGTGLGLFITRQIVEEHGGSIRVQPKEKGNSFIFEIERS